MGHAVAQLALAGARGVTAVYGVDPAGSVDGVVSYRRLSDAECDVDCIIDFSHHGATGELLAYALSERLPVVIATTGQTAEELRQIDAAAADIPIFRSANMSLGVALLVELAKVAAKTMPDADIEIIEKHHNRKLDAPSGTALMIANAIKKVREKSRFVFGRYGQAKRSSDEIGIHAVRMGNIVGEHEVLIGTDNETITIKHEAHNRALFAEGALAAASFLITRPAGLYSMQDMVSIM